MKGDPAASLQLKVNAGAFGPLTSGVASAGQTLNAGPNTITVRVTAMDTTTQDYTVNAVLRPSGSVPTVTSSVSGSTLTLGWPSTHLGYELQTQTNAASKEYPPGEWAA